MSYEDGVDFLQRLLQRSGFRLLRTPTNIDVLVREWAIEDCEIIANKDRYGIIYLEAKSNWKSIANDVLNNTPNPCLVITKYQKIYFILSTLKDSKVRHVIIDSNSQTNSIQEFINLINVSNSNTKIINKKIESVFDKFSLYDEAVKEFSENLSTIVQSISKLLDKNILNNNKYLKEAKKLLDMCKEIINETMDMTDIKNMLLQHVLTHKIFALIYDNFDLYDHNSVARSLENLRLILNIPEEKVDYKTMELIADSITELSQKQEFLKKVYEAFYKKYDPKKAEKFGIVYTPTEVVDFMIRSTNYLLKKHFKKNISSKNVTILDPATGTGTFIAHILKQIDPDKRKLKYTKDLHANEISILPYYIATLNIENTYRELTNKSQEFENICWMDTLDSGTKNYEKMTAYIEGNDNVKRIERQQKSKIHIVIGNPPYNAVQTSFNDANPADKYPHIDKKIQEDYTKLSNVKNNNNSLDMYKRFLKWSSNRINENGMVVFISNNAFLDAKSDDGFRRAVYEEFDHIYIVNLKGNARLAGESRKREGGNLFGQQARVGITISFFIKTGEKTTDLQYAEIDDYKTREEKLTWLDDNTVNTLNFKKIIPTDDAIWLNQTNNDFNNLIALLPRTTKESIFETSATGVTTGKDAWVYSFDRNNLASKMKYYISIYNKHVEEIRDDMPELHKWVSKKIKWASGTFLKLKQKRKTNYIEENIKSTLYRPFVVKKQYYDGGVGIITHRQSNFSLIFKNSKKNLLITFPNPKTNVEFRTLATDMITDYGLIDGTQNIPLWKYDNSGKRSSNVTKYAIKLFNEYYKFSITEEDIFYYVYAIFNDPKYEKKYRHNLRREFPKLPLAKDFRKYSEIGKDLFEIHCNFNNVEEYALERVDKNVKNDVPKLLLREIEGDLKIIIDKSTTLSNVPKKIQKYMLGSKNPIEYILEYYKENKNSMSESDSDDEEIRQKFATYKFSDYKEKHLIPLLKKIITVCVKTVDLRSMLETLDWGDQIKQNTTSFSCVSTDTIQDDGTHSKKYKSNKQTPKKIKNQTLYSGLYVKQTQLL